MASSLISAIWRNRTAGVVASALAALALADAAQAQQTGNRVDVITAPIINGSAVVGNTLTSGGGAWMSPNPEPSRTDVWWEWWRCPSTNNLWRCRVQLRSPQWATTSTYTLTSSDQGQFIYLVRYVRWRDTRGTARTDDDDFRTDWRPSAPSARVAAPAPTPAPTPTPTPTPLPTVAPTFEVPTPVATGEPLLTDTPSQRRAIKPFPEVRMRGKLTRRGERVTLLTVRAPKSARVVIRCKGQSCPTGRWAPAKRKKQLTRARTFERSLRAGTRISVTVSRPRYIGKRTIFVIRKGRVPKRVDNCINSRGRVTRCPAGI